ncbi:arylamine N-acetyltransferase family protein [Allonocardiopsis opalescens]|uniref:N-hydroxyarylamine O-acetyltransferase n=1 Tax=Allonocardiopsis opalescens TaxID=1144618 RepID=A0A2T0Q5Q0_9ACTN|nr:arylamine N-acetyltransferase [Allonocardiopsis opalescens]PRX99116.1 N-hydroxyarylamine O-acetyltransferase [Allonocardiopsis opalescens]
MPETRRSPAAAPIAAARPADWGGAGVDLDAYLARLGHTGGTAPTLDTLHALHRAHAAAIPFENIDPALGHPVSLDIGDIQDKLVRRPRGGYCYEHNLLLAAVLERLGYAVTGYVARVRMGSDQVRPTSHALLGVDLDGRTWLADVGFGGEGLLEPLPRRDGAEVRQGGWSFRLDRMAAADGTAMWVLRSLHPDGWFDLHSFTLDPQHPADYAVRNHYTATHPRSPFTGQLLCQRTGPEARTTLRDLTLATTTPDGATTERTLTPAELPGVLRDTFGIEPDGPDLAAITRLAARDAVATAR